jgi:hypothetical protein
MAAAWGSRVRRSLGLGGRPAIYAPGAPRERGGWSLDNPNTVPPGVLGSPETSGDMSVIVREPHWSRVGLKNEP